MGYILLHILAIIGAILLSVTIWVYMSLIKDNKRIKKDRTMPWKYEDWHLGKATKPSKKLRF